VAGGVTAQLLCCMMEQAALSGGQRGLKRPIERREYDIVAPHMMWHHDGWHKMPYKTTGIVVHAFIDGATRKIVGCCASTLNTGQQVLDIFKAAVEEQGVFPLFVRGDKGTENRRLCEHVLEVRGLERSPVNNCHHYIASKSTANQRIKSWWGQMHKRCLQRYRQLFLDLASDKVYDGDIPFHRAVLQYLFLPLINEELQRFVGSWNHHPMRTERNRVSAGLSRCDVQHLTISHLSPSPSLSLQSRLSCLTLPPSSLLLRPQSPVQIEHLRWDQVPEQPRGEQAPGGQAARNAVAAALNADVEDGLDDEDDAEAVAEPVQDNDDDDDDFVELSAPQWEWPFEEEGGFEAFQQQFPPFTLATKGNTDNLWNTFADALQHIQNLYDARRN